MKKSPGFRLLIFIVAIILLGYFIWWYTKPAANIGGNVSRRSAQAGVLVNVIHPQIKDAPLSIQEVGSVEAEQTVNIISQVTGILKK